MNVGGKTKEFLERVVGRWKKDEEERKISMCLQMNGEGEFLRCVCVELARATVNKHAD